MNSTEWPVVIADGDAVGGWVVSVHDGDRFRVYSPDAPTAAEARQAALETWATEMVAVPAAAPPSEPAASAFTSAEQAADQAASVSVNVLGVAR